MYTHITIGKVNIVLVFRHILEKKDTMYSMFRTKELGIFFSTKRVVGRKNFHIPKEWNRNLVNEYVFGISLLIIKMWIAINYNGMYFKEN